MKNLGMSAEYFYQFGHNEPSSTLDVICNIPNVPFEMVYARIIAKSNLDSQLLPLLIAVTLFIWVSVLFYDFLKKKRINYVVSIPSAIIAGTLIGILGYTSYWYMQVSSIILDFG